MGQCLLSSCTAKVPIHSRVSRGPVNGWRDKPAGHRVQGSASNSRLDRTNVKCYSDARMQNGARSLHLGETW